MHGEVPPPLHGEEAGLAMKTTRRIIHIGKLGTTLDQLWTTLDNSRQLVAVMDIPLVATRKSLLRASRSVLAHALQM